MSAEIPGYLPDRLIMEVKTRPELWKVGEAVDREHKLKLWKEVGAAIFSDWEQLTKATKYDRVLQLQKKWRSLRDAYARELRVRRSGVRINKRVYIYFTRMSFLGGFEGKIEDDELVFNDMEETQTHYDEESNDPLLHIKKKRKKRTKRKAEEDEKPLFSHMSIDTGESEADSDKLFLLSFVPEMRQLPRKVKMWARAQIANVMQEAVSRVDNDTHPDEVKRHRDSLDSGTD